MFIKRNNPGNIRKSAAYRWQGETQGIMPGEFVEFDTLNNGFRAHIKLLNNYIGMGYDTIQKIIYRWAPEADNNDSAAYTKFVGNKTGIDPVAVVIKKNDYDTLAKIALAMTYMEHGINKDDGTLYEALTKAKSVLEGVKETAETVIHNIKNNPGMLLVVIIAAFIFFKK